MSWLKSCLALCLAVLPAMARAQMPSALVDGHPLPAAWLNSLYYGVGLNVKDPAFGAKLDGVTDDSAALAAARAAAHPNQTIVVPAGGLNMATPPSPAVGVNSGLRWLLDGVTFGTSGVSPVLGITKGDLVETSFSGTKFFGRTSNRIDANPAVRIDYTLDTAGGTNGNVSNALQINAVSNPGVVTSLWPFRIGMTSTANNNGANWPQNVGGQITVTKSGTAPTWGAQFNLVDTLGTASSLSGSMIGLEIGYNVNDVDDGNAGTGVRRVLDLIVASPAGTPGVVHDGIMLRTQAGASITNGFSAQGGLIAHALNANGTQVGLYVTGSTSVGVDTSSATLAGPAIRIGTGQRISLEATDNRTLSYDAGTQKLFYAVGGVNKWSVDASGNARFAGTVTGSVAP